MRRPRFLDQASEPQYGDFVSDVDESFAYGVPAEPAWPRFGQLQVNYLVPFRLPGTQPINHLTVNVATVDFDTISSGELSPLISPVRNLRVNGASAALDLSDVTLPMTVTWD